MDIRILAIGDVCGEIGMSFLNNRLKDTISRERINFTVVNGENANVVGITPKQAEFLMRAGADVVLTDNFFDMNPGEKCVRIVRGTPADDLKARSVFDIR